LNSTTENTTHFFVSLERKIGQDGKSRQTARRRGFGGDGGDVDDQPAERGTDGDRPGGHQEPAVGGAEGIQALKEEGGRAHHAVPPDPQANLGGEGDHGKDDEGQLVVPDAGQVRDGRRHRSHHREHRRGGERPRAIPRRQRRGGQAPAIRTPPRRDDIRERRSHRPRPRRHAAAEREEALPRRGGIARGARELTDRVHHPGRRHQDHQPTESTRWRTW